VIRALTVGIVSVGNWRVIVDVDGLRDEITIKSPTQSQAIISATEIAEDMGGDFTDVVLLQEISQGLASMYEE